MRRTFCHLVGILPEFLARPALAEQVPALVQGLLHRPQLLVLGVRGQLALGDLLPQFMLGLYEFVDVAENLLVVHVPYGTRYGQQSSANPSRYDAVVVGGGHNGLTAAAYLARGGRSVLVLERQSQVGGAAVSTAPFPGVDVRLSRYSYLVSLFPSSIIRDLGLPIELRPRRIASYTPGGDGGLLVDNTDPARTAASFASVTGGEADWHAWKRLRAVTAQLASRMAPTMTEPLLTPAEMSEVVGDSAAWDMITKRPLGETVAAEFGSDTVRGVVLTDAVVGTFARAGESSLLQNRCYLYHVIGNGTGAWNVPVGGMGAVTSALAEAALAAARRSGPAPR